MGRDAHEDVREGDEEAVGEETELLSTASLEGLDFDRFRLTQKDKSYNSWLRLLEERLGEFGPYQRKLYLLVCLPAALTATITMARFSLQNPYYIRFSIIPLISTLLPTASSLLTLLCTDALCHSVMIAHFPHTGDQHFISSVIN